MVIELGHAFLKSGERMEIGVVEAPEPDWHARLTTFLSHKGPEWMAQISESLQGPLDDLQTRFYVGQVQGEVICQIMITGDRGVGILGHVFTRPEHRRKGAIQSLITRLMEDCPQRGYRVLTLGTGFDSPAYWIYHSVGFRSIAEGSGGMIWRYQPEAEVDLFRPGPCTVRPVQWHDWSAFNLLAAQPVGPSEDLPRSRLMGLKGQGGVEGDFLRFQGRRRREPSMQAMALVAETGATVGWALLSPDPALWRDVWMLDLHTHPHYMDSLSALLASLQMPDAPVVSYVTHADGSKALALQAAGFEQSARLHGWLNYGGRHDLFLMTRA